MTSNNFAIRPILTHTLGAILVGLLTTAAILPARAENSAAIFAYFQIGRDEDPDSNLRIEQFQAQIEALQQDGFTILPVTEIISAFENRKSLPDQAIGLTFDEAYRSVADNALPILRQARLPATIFITPRLIDKGGDYMSWNELRRAQHDGFSVGAKIDLDDVEDDSPDKIIAAVNESITRIQTELGMPPTLFAYAEGIAAKPMRDAVRSRGLKAAFAIQSGPASAQSDRFLLPRFPMTEEYGTLDRFEIAANSLPLPVTDVLPQDMVVTGPNPPQIGFTVTDGEIDLKKLACFIEDQGKAPLQVLGNRVEIRAVSPFETEDDTRVNCTVPASGSDQGRWHWLGFDFYVPAPG